MTALIQIWITTQLAIATVRATDSPISQIDTTGFEVMLAEVIETNPALLMRQENIVSQQENVFQNKLSFLRSFRLGFQFNSQTSEDLTNTVGAVPDLGFNIQLDLESIIAAPSRTKQARADLRAAEQDYIQTRRELEKELFSRFAAYKKSIESYRIQLEKFRAIDKTHAIAKQKFSHGEIPLDQYSQSIEAQAKAREELLAAELDLQLAQASLRELAGK